MELILEVEHSVAIKRKKPWPQLNWLGEVGVWSKVGGGLAAKNTKLIIHDLLFHYFWHIFSHWRARGNDLSTES